MPQVTKTSDVPFKQREFVVATAEQAQVVHLLEALRQGGAGPLTLGETTLPEGVAEAVFAVLESMAIGPVLVTPSAATLTTTQAAKMLGVSRQYFVRLLKTGKIPFEMVGTHQKVRAFDVQAYRARRAQRRAALDELTRLAEESGGYDEIPDAEG